ncbi:hypothetical protein CRI93_07160 [Longimonas halophila]|uniref:Lipid/polyisoprenoid-binding YceI-like domain-containing protein n=1 Tax=Longimonas halophila TaxID=1469170 RepID=A0A2H3P808_9BACT|nr:hypothetical protein [Longimonas halophila]PEN07755.1 hypothetical protein CRI93_07160 [Longimonas halophila]
MMRFSYGTLSALLIATLFLVGCDDTGTGTEDTIVIGTDADPVEFEFEFEPFSADDVTDGTLTLTSTNSDNLDSQIQGIVGTGRSDVVSARIRSVRLERLTGNFGAETGGRLGAQPKVFSYLGSARVYYGTNTSAQPVAERRPISDEPEVTLDLLQQDITPIVQNGSSPLTLELEVNDPSLIGTGDDVEITVSYRIEVSG